MNDSVSYRVYVRQRKGKKAKECKEVEEEEMLIF